MKEMPGKDETTAIHRYLAGEMDVTERVQFEERMRSEPDLGASYRAFHTAWEAAGAYQVPAFDTADALREFKKTTGRQTSRRRIIRLSAAAAVVLTLVAIGSLWLRSDRSGEFLYADTAFTKVLDDGSQITLRQGAAIEIPRRFGKGERRVRLLKGEAFFDIAADAERPFIVDHHWADVQVTGTEFVVAVDSVSGVYVLKVTEGEVLFTPDLSKTSIPVRAGSGLRFDRDTRVVDRFREVDENAVSWKTGALTFRQASLEKVVQDLEAHYGIMIRIAEPQLNRCTFTAELPYTDVPVTTILNALSTAFGLTVEKVASGDYILRGGKCK